MNKKNDSNWVVWTVLKCIFIPLIVAFLVFFLTTMLAVSFKIFKIAVPAIIVKGIIPIIQLVVPIIILMFGWLVILLIDLSKHKK